MQRFLWLIVVLFIGVSCGGGSLSPGGSTGHSSDHNLGDGTPITILPTKTVTPTPGTKPTNLIVPSATATASPTPDGFSNDNANENANGNAGENRQ
jgi:hypothetical protein